MKLLGRTRRVHFVGIGGIGMSGIAELLANLGLYASAAPTRGDRTSPTGSPRSACASRSDMPAPTSATPTSSSCRRRLRADNPEVAAARARHVPVIPRAEMLAELMRLRFGIAIAGAHGKTTTTSMVALMLERGGPRSDGGHRRPAERVRQQRAARAAGKYMVAEADESDRSFLKLSPAIAVITNIDREHMEAYGSFDRLVDAFQDFADRVPFYGAVVACLDDPPVAALMPRLTRRVVTYGFAEGADVRGEAPSTDGHAGRCRRPLSRPRRSRTVRAAGTLVARRARRAQPAECARRRRRRPRSRACRSIGLRARSPSSAAPSGATRREARHAA